MMAQALANQHPEAARFGRQHGAATIFGCTIIKHCRNTQIPLRSNPPSPLRGDGWGVQHRVEGTLHLMTIMAHRPNLPTPRFPCEVHAAPR